MTIRQLTNRIKSDRDAMILLTAAAYLVAGTAVLYGLAALAALVGP